MLANSLNFGWDDTPQLLLLNHVDPMKSKRIMRMYF